NISKNIKEYAKNKEFSIYKISADEFVLLRRYKDYNLEYLHKNTLDILESLDNMKITINNLDNDIFINITIGISFNKKDVLTKASSALDLAKVKNKKFVLYDKSDKYYEELEQLFHWQKKIRDALNNDNIVPFFQPIYNKDKEIQKYEVLMRMKEVEENQTKYISPFFFLDISIKTKQYDQLSYRIISKAFDIAKDNKDKVFSINLGYRDMTNENIKKLILDYSNRRKLNGEKCNLVFEIVESEDISDYNVIKNFFQDIGCSNIKVAIDDFGSGYSNFSHILKIMPTYLKIDGSLIKDINTNENMKTLSKAIISFAKKLGIKTIAEFVHSQEIFDILQKEGVDEYQGFYLGEPSPTL
ncbi:MAG: EAL domain-containing protein, partial [Campylobacterota bacterium]|nr:EAL domain-containing protein [Campylobacterota bacterium]